MSAKPEVSRDDFLATVRPEDLGGDMGIVAGQCGLEVAVRLVQTMGGTQLSVPKYALKKAAVRFIRANYTGSNAKSLALATGMTERFVYEAVASGTVKNDQHRLV